jgi:hypothetical protein
MTTGQAARSIETTSHYPQMPEPSANETVEDPGPSTEALPLGENYPS